LVYGQDNGIRWHENERLRWVDFDGEVNDTSVFDAECFAEIRYHYKFNDLKNFQFNVFSNFIKKASWSRKEYQTEDLLKHEQMHFDIAELFSRRMKEMFQNYNYTENYQAEIHQLFDRSKQEYHLMQQQYDEETEHSLNKIKQNEWEAYITGELTQMKLKQNFCQK
jgi:hypothetical protein